MVNRQVEPLIVNGKEYMKIGWNEYEADPALGYGWYGDMAHVEYRHLNSGPNELQKSVIYDDWGRQKTFEFDLPNGEYDVTVSVGWQGRVYAHNQIEVEGVGFVENEASDPYVVRTKRVAVADSKLTVVMGIFDEYTMLNYLTSRLCRAFNRVEGSLFAFDNKGALRPEPQRPGPSAPGHENTQRSRGADEPLARLASAGAGNSHWLEKSRIFTFPASRVTQRHSGGNGLLSRDVRHLSMSGLGSLNQIR